MALTRIKNNQTTDANASQSNSTTYTASIGNTKELSGILASSKLVNYSVTGDKWANAVTAVTDLTLNRDNGIGGNLTVEGNLVVLGSVTSIEATTTRISDSLIQLGYGNDSGGLAANADLGIIFTLSGDNAAFIYDQASGQFQLGFTSDDAYSANVDISVASFANLRVNQLQSTSFATANLVFANNTISTDGTAAGTDIIIRPNSSTGNINLYSNNTIVANTNTIIQGTLTTTKTATVGNINTTGLISADGNITGGNLISNAGISSTTLTTTGNTTVGNLNTAGTVNATGNITGGNLVSNAGVSATTVTATGNVSGGNLTTAGAVTATGLVSGGNIATTGAVTATGNITGGNLVSNAGISGTTLTTTSTATVGNLNTRVL